MPDQDWIPVPDAPEQIEEMLVDDLDLIGELTHPLRSRVLHRLRRPHSVAELAESLEVPVTRLYHHINRLEEIGMISVVATRRAGARTEHRYRNAALDFRLDDKVIAATDAATFARTVGSLFDVARTEILREIEIGGLSPQRVHGQASIAFSEFSLDDDALAEFLDRLHALLAEYSKIDEQTDSHNRWRLFLAGFPLTD
jgi:DNA-binding transcriptional ArsR family regulator